MALLFVYFSCKEHLTPFYSQNPGQRGSGLELSVFRLTLYDLAHSRVMNPQVSANLAEGVTVFDMRCNDRPVSFITSGPMEELLQLRPVGVSLNAWNFCKCIGFLIRLFISRTNGSSPR